MFRIIAILLQILRISPSFLAFSLMISNRPSRGGCKRGSNKGILQVRLNIKVFVLYPVGLPRIEFF